MTNYIQMAMKDDGVSSFTRIFQFLGNPRISMSLCKLLGCKRNRAELIFLLHMCGFPGSPALRRGYDTLPLLG